MYLSESQQSNDRASQKASLEINNWFKETAEDKSRKRKPFVFIGADDKDPWLRKESAKTTRNILFPRLQHTLKAAKKREESHDSEDGELV